MSIFDRLLGRPEPPPPEPRPLENLFAGLLRPAVHLRTTGAETGSYFGGLPELPAHAAWPEKDSSPLAFLAALDLAEVAAVERFEWLPAAGRLLFFYDLAEQPWGFDPADAGSWRAIFVEPGELVATPPTPAGLDPDHLLPRRGINFRRVELPPSMGNEAVDPLDLTDAEIEALDEYRASLLGGAPEHQIGGYPNPMQSDDMELECQLASNGIDCGDPAGYEDPRVESLTPGAADWRLLLQLDSDDDLDLMWGDAGLLYFWIREQDARQRRFENAWLILQCG